MGWEAATPQEVGGWSRAAWRPGPVPPAAISPCPPPPDPAAGTASPGATPSSPWLTTSCCHAWVGAQRAFSCCRRRRCCRWDYCRCCCCCRAVNPGRSRCTRASTDTRPLLLFPPHLRSHRPGLLLLSCHPGAALPACGRGVSCLSRSPTANRRRKRRRCTVQVGSPGAPLPPRCRPAD